MKTLLLALVVLCFNAHADISSDFKQINEEIRVLKLEEIEATHKENTRYINKSYSVQREIHDQIETLNAEKEYNNKNKNKEVDKKIKALEKEAKKVVKEQEKEHKNILKGIKKSTKEKISAIKKSFKKTERMAKKKK